MLRTIERNQPSFPIIETRPRDPSLCVNRVAIWYGDQLLFLQRHSDAKNYPDYLEFPGGKTDPADESMFKSMLRELEEELGPQILQHLQIFTTPTIEHTYRMTRRANSHYGLTVQTNLYEAALPINIVPTEKISLRWQKVSKSNPIPPEHYNSILLITPEKMIKMHNNNRGARIHRGSSAGLAYFAEKGNPFESYRSEQNLR